MARMQLVDKVEEGLLVHALHRARDGAMAIGKRLIVLPGWSEQCLKGRGEKRANMGAAALPLVSDLLPMVAEIGLFEREGPAVEQANDLSHFRQEYGLAIRREPHDLVLVTVVWKAEILRQSLVEDPERMG